MIVHFRLMYGDPELIDQFEFLENIEDIAVCGVPKALATAI